MALDPTLSAINCTSCGAGLDVLGGGRVKVHICPYCGTMLDAHEGYQTLRTFQDMPRPESPMRIGMTGTWDGVDYTIIGTLGLRERHNGETWDWVDHQLYSPTHGYAWITYEDGHFVWTRRLRDRAWMSSMQVETAEHCPSIWVNHESYKYFETSESEITFAEGEFTWVPVVGERATTISALSDKAMISFTQTGNEREVERSVYLPRERVKQAFDLADMPERRSFHPLTPIYGKATVDFLRVAPVLLAVVCLVLGLGMGRTLGVTVLGNMRIPVADLPTEISIDVPYADRLTRIEITGDVKNSWAWVDLEVSDPDDVPVFVTGRTLEYYHGVEDGEAWIEGKGRTTRVYFRPQTPGVHTLSLEVAETGTWGVRDASQPAVNHLSLSVGAGESSGTWLYRLACIFVAIAVLAGLFRFFQYKRRWVQSDWTDE